jgi:hypothetical protein
VPGRSAAIELERARQLESVRIRGVKGGVIAPHRSMVGLPWTVWRLVSTLILSLGGVAALLAALPYIGRFWQEVFERVRDFLGIHAPLGDQILSLPGGFSFTLPLLAVATPLPDSLVLWIAGIVCAVVFVASFALPERFIPLRYLLRFLVVLQGSAILFFAVSRDPFPYRLQDHVFILLTAGLVVMGLVPLLLGLTLHLFDLAFWKKLLLTLAILVHLAVWLPLQALVHLWLILHGTALVMPVLFLIGGLLLDVLIFVGFYGWALSWRGELERRQTMPPVHLGRKARRGRGRQ